MRKINAKTPDYRKKQGNLMKEKKIFSRCSVILLSLFFISAVFFALSLASSGLANFLVATVGRVIRQTLGTLTGILPFSLFEIVLLLLPVIIALVIFFGIRALKRGEGGRYIVSLLAVASLFGTTFIYTLGLPYKTTRISERMSLDTSDEYVTENLREVAFFVRDELNKYAEKVSPAEGGTEMPYGMREMSGRISKGYRALSEKYSYIEGYKSYAKPVLFSGVMSDAGLTGIYTYPTGEANVNVEYPDYYIPFTAAHEMAHARGITREDEASFVAFLASVESGDDYIIYSAYLNIYEYLASALYDIDKKAHKELVSGLSGTARSDILAAYEVYTEHEDSKLGEINDKLNDAYLQANGEDGTVSYSYVVKLVVAYLSK